MSTVTFVCTNPSCQRPLTFDQTTVGTVQQCPHCDQRLIVPDAAPLAPQAAVMPMYAPPPVYSAPTMPLPAAFAPAGAPYRKPDGAKAKYGFRLFRNDRGHLRIRHFELWRFHSSHQHQPERKHRRCWRNSPYARRVSWIGRIHLLRLHRHRDNVVVERQRTAVGNVGVRDQELGYRSRIAFNRERRLVCSRNSFAGRVRSVSL